jgi:hypothetical protein
MAGNYNVGERILTLIRHVAQAVDLQLSFTFPRFLPTLLADMDKFWSELTMPIGVALCFGPAMIVWWLTEGRKPRTEESEDKRKP